MASQNLSAGKKRRADGPLTPRGAPKRRKPEIAVQSGKNGEINVTNFVKAREFEIKALEDNMKAMRKKLSSRAFQQLPRHMRRRTASHNVKKVPRRLRKRATKEMKDDNTPTVSKRMKTPSRKLRLRLENVKSLQKANEKSKKVRQKKKKDTVGRSKEVSKDNEQDPEKQAAVARIPRIKKNTLAKPPTATSKYKRRQVNKTWLPTHLWHAKRAHITRPTEPLWRLAIPLRPTEKSYRPTHRASSMRGCIAWDTSYMSTVACRGTDHTLENLLQALKFELVKNATIVKRWKAGVRYAEGFVHTTCNGKLLGPALVIWAHPQAKGTESKIPASLEGSGKRQKVKLDRRMLIRVHPAMFKDFWAELLRAAKMQKPQVLVEDLRFEVGSIHVTGPASTEALLAVLQPRSEPTELNVALNTWTSLAGLNNSASVPLRAMLSFDIVDPRLSHPPKQLKIPSDQASLNRLTELVATWPVDQSEPIVNMFSHKARWLASTHLPSQQAINRRKAAAGAGNTIAVVDKDPAIPVTLLAHRPPSGDPNASGSWTVLLPWCAVDAVWRSLLYYPISSGRTPRFGGLKQTQQLAFEQMVTWYPADLPGTEAGKAWERTESEKRFDAWIRRPPGRRLRWDLVDLGLGRRGELGRGWMCDWTYLFSDTKEKTGNGSQMEQNTAAADNELEMSELNEDRSRRRNTSSPESSPEPEADKNAEELESHFYQLTPGKASTLLHPKRFKSGDKSGLGAPPAVGSVRIRLLTKGTPEPGARVYRLPKTIKPATSPGASMPPPSSFRGPSQHITATSSFPASAEIHASSHPATSTSTSSAPPPGQRSPPSPLSEEFTSLRPAPGSTPYSVSLSLREKWLSLLPESYYHSPTNHATKNTHLSSHNAQRIHHVHPPSVENHNLSLINVFPPRASPSLIAKFDTQPSEAQLAEFEKEELLRELLKNDAVKLANDGKEVVWDASKGIVECPDEEDLIGFVTSGGFNLKEGRGTAVAGVWVQRVREGWAEEVEGLEEGHQGGSLTADDARSVGAANGNNGQNSKGKPGSRTSQKGSANGKGKSKGTAGSTQQNEADRLRERRIKERTLCIVRNAGSGVGRLGWWEVCE